MTPSRNLPVSLNPITSGISIVTGWPSIAASASMPPTPHASTPKPFAIVVCESVPTTVSGYATVVPPGCASPAPPAPKITRARYSMLTWCTIPVSGGTARKPSSDDWPHFRNAYRSPLRSNSSCAFFSNASGDAHASTCTE